MSTKTQNNALESAELGAKVDAIVQIVQEMAQEKPTSVNAYGLSTWTKAKKLITDLVKSYSAPVAAQPDVTQQTLNDVMAGIPARDAEIEALRKEIETLRAQQPVSGADGLPTERVLIDGTAYELPAAVAAELLRLHLEILGSEQAQSSGNPEQLDHLPDATKMVPGDQSRDTAQMIEPSGNSRELGEHNLSTSAGGRAYVAEYFSKRLGRHDFTRYISGRLAVDFACALAQHLSQQDANKVDAERYRAWRDAAVANSTPFVRAMRDTLPPEAREGKPRWPTASEWDAAIDAARKEQA
jgi:hypothetical protein